jgi:glycosyltransferase involved in cell wall biosynthesis
MSSILLVLPVPFREIDGTLHIESQAANGLDRWADNFDGVVAACPVMPEHVAKKRASWKWVPEDALEHRRRVRLVTLPLAWSLGIFVGEYGRVRRQLLGRFIAECDYLQFAIGGLIGDWPSVAALEARRMGRPYAVWTDRVESEVVRITATGHSFPKKQLARSNAWLMKHYERHIIRHARLGLFHGAETYQAYASLPQHAFLTHDIHTKPGDLIPHDALLRKREFAEDDALPLRIGYAGRATSMKAPLDWLEVLVRLRDQGVAFEAAWLGDGEMLADMREYVDRHALGDVVSLPGFVSDRQQVLSFLRSCNVLLCTHVTPESPRIILEALISGVPVVGYENGYIADVVGEEGRRLLTPMGSIDRLADLISSLAKDRTVLSEAIRSAALTGTHFNDQAVFRHRSELIKQYL